jgi:hypothetical protein
MKSPMNQRPDDEARGATEKFIAEYARKPLSGVQSPPAQPSTTPSESASA